jgi:putative glycosyltransferase (TIGR04348 family)
MNRPRLCIVTPAFASANNGNWHTAARWQQFLSPVAQVDVDQAWHEQDAHALIALHARRSAESIARFHARYPRRPLALVLTGTDLYGDLQAGDAAARHSIECASHLVVLQDEALQILPQAWRPRARVVVQSAPRLVRRDGARRSFDFVAAGHLRAVKDPLTLMRAARELPAELGVRVLHIGGALDEALGREAQRTMAECPHYRWLGGLPPGATRRWIARARALVHMSLMEGGANVVIEAVRSEVPVLASCIDGNVGLLGREYAGYFEAGDATALAALMRRFQGDADFAARLRGQCMARSARFAPQVEADAVRTLLADMLAPLGNA